MTLPAWLLRNCSLLQFLTALPGHEPGWMLLTERLQLHRTPDLHFEAALPASLAAKVPQILKRIKRGRSKSDSNEPEKNATP